MFRSSKSTQQAVLAVLLALTLLGAQAVKASPWHDHATHTVDCGLCHLQAFEADLPHLPPAPPPLARAPARAFDETRLFASSTHSPYRSRAPPAIL